MLLKYMGRGFVLLIFVHVAPPSSERYTPVAPAGWRGALDISSVGGGAAAPPAPGRAAEGASTVAYTMLPLCRNTSTAMRPSGPVGKPVPVTLVHVSPPSVLLKSALPGPPPFMQQAVRRRWYMLAKSTFGSAMEMATSLAPVSSSPLSTCFQVSPPSVVLYTPRSPPGPKSGPVAATNTMFSLVGCRTMRLMCLLLGSPISANVLPPSVLL